MRLNGASYEQVARAGGGIVSTVEATRAATQEALVSAALPRVDALIAEGVSTIEIKSGYGLNQEDELKMLRAARQIAQLRGIHITTTYLGAHAVPPEYTGREDTYIDDGLHPDAAPRTYTGPCRCGGRFLRGHRFSTCASRTGF